MYEVKLIKNRILVKVEGLSYYCDFCSPTKAKAIRNEFDCAEEYPTIQELEVRGFKQVSK